MTKKLTNIDNSRFKEKQMLQLPKKVLRKNVGLKKKMYPKLLKSMIKLIIKNLLR